MIIIRSETEADIDAVRKVNRLAFGQAAEAALVDALRKSAERFISLVAVDDNLVVGHIFFTPVSLDVPASQKGLTSEYPVPDEVFMAIELEPGALKGRRGLVKYRPEFAEV